MAVLEKGPGRQIYPGDSLDVVNGRREQGVLKSTVETAGVKDSGAMSEQFITKDSGERLVFESGMQRDIEEGKDFWALVFDGPMLRRWVKLLTRGAVKYVKRNWMKASGQEEYQRFKESAARHFAQWYYDERDEDHAAAIFFNVNGAEHVRESLYPSKPKPRSITDEPQKQGLEHPLKVPRDVKPIDRVGGKQIDPHSFRRFHGQEEEES